jgi:putative ABC transport system substrate-binding protein
MIALLLSLLASAAHARSDVVVLVSDTLAAYDAPVARFSASIGRPTTTFDIEGDRARADTILAQLQADPPPLVLALGAKAAYAAVNGLPEVPVIYAMVRDPERYGVRGTRVTGVSMDVPADVALAQFQLFAPEVRRLGVLLTPGNSAPTTQAALEAARDMGFDVTIQRVTNSRDLRSAWGRMREDADALWLLPDPVVITPASFRYLRSESARYRVPMLATTESLVQAGAVMCVAPDRDVLGQQAAELARRVLDGGELPGVIEPPPPGAFRVVLNRSALDAAGIVVDPMLLDFVDEVVEDAQGR